MQLQHKAVSVVRRFATHSRSNLDLDARVLLDLVDGGATGTNQMAEVLWVALDFGKCQTILQIGDLLLKVGNHSLSIGSWAFNINGIVFAEVDVNLGMSLAELQNVGALGANQVAVQPVGNLDGNGCHGLSEVVHQAVGFSELAGLTTQSNNVAGRVSGWQLDVDTSGLEHLVKIRALGSTYELVLGLVDGNGQLTAGSLEHSITLLDGGNDFGNTSLVTADDDLVLHNGKTKQNDGHSFSD
jgi:hypothetical protein